jgi:integrase
MTGQVVMNEYQLDHSCITVAEVRWILHHLERHSPHYTYFLLRLTTGIRGGELIENITTRHIRDGGRTIAYRIMKPAQRQTRDGLSLTVNKHRVVHLDQWVAGELLSYLGRFGRVVGGEFIMPFPNGRLFPWKKNAVAASYWYKLRSRMKKEGFDADRMVREWLRDNGQVQYKPVYVLRPHILRHFYASVLYVKVGCDLKRVQEEIQHSHIQTTSQYVHSCVQLGVSEVFLRDADWAKILGFDSCQVVLKGFSLCSQTPLDTFF